MQVPGFGFWGSGVRLVKASPSNLCFGGMVQGARRTGSPLSTARNPDYFAADPEGKAAAEPE